MRQERWTRTRSTDKRAPTDVHARLHVVATNAALASESIASIHRWLEVWSTPKLVHEATIEWSHRLTRSLGRCYPERRLIRLAPSLNDAPRALLEEVLCHELAHLAAREIHGPQIRPHGPESRRSVTRKTPLAAAARRDATDPIRAPSTS